MNKRTVVMVVVDGWGVGTKDETNPIYVKNPPNLNLIKYHFPAGVIQASGIAVGLPWNEEGNSEVGHLTLGAGRVIYQHYPRISLAIRNGTFFENKVLLDNMRGAKAAGKNVHVVGVLSAGNVHGSLEHIAALVKLAKSEGLPKLVLHPFTDGKDGPPKDGPRLLRKIFEAAKDSGYEGLYIGSVSGRYYGMDRDKHWNRTGKAYEAITGLIKQIQNSNDRDNGFEQAISYIESQYAKGLTDEYVEPVTIDPEDAVKDGDSVIFFNFREDSIRQLVEMFLQNISQNLNPEPEALNKVEYQNPDIKKFENLNIATFTNYNDEYKLPVAFPPEDVTNPLGKVLADHGKRQLRIAETNKYAHVTYFFNGFVESPFKEEYRILVPSDNVARYDERPEMKAAEITTRTLEALGENIYDFILINYANADIVAHTGNYEATLRAVEIVDEQIGRLMDAVLKQNAVLIITADHGNAEKLRDAATGLPETSHDSSPVPIYIVARELKRDKDDYDVEMSEKTSAGLLSDVAPTVLEIMGIPQPPEMTGISLLRILS